MDQALTTAPHDIHDVFGRARQASRDSSVPMEQRRAHLATLRKILVDNEQAFADAICADFGNRSSVETLIAETLFVLGDIKHTLANLNRWSATKRISTQLQFFPSSNRLIPQPLGVVGIIAPWNYPLQLTLAPAIAAIAAGNRVMIKPSELTPNFATLLRELIAANFADTDVYIADHNAEIAPQFAGLPFDHLLFTGSTNVGRKVAEAAGRNLTPVTLELGGKSPVIIDKSADIKLVAERVAFAKLLNAGQTCIAPDYVLIAREQMESFATHVADAFTRMYGTRADNPDYTSIISPRHHARLSELVADAREAGARITQTASAEDDAWQAARKYPPTIIQNATRDMKVMQSEIFGPILPIVACDSVDAAITYINASDRPLALYWFGSDDAARDKVLAKTISGGVTINDCIFHVAQTNQPFGGVGTSGSGAYHGEWGFQTFSKMKPVFYRSALSRLSDIYPPYGAKIARMIKLLRFMS